MAQQTGTGRQPGPQGQRPPQQSPPTTGAAGAPPKIEVREPSALEVRRERYGALVDRMTTQVVGALSITIPQEALKRARARFRIAFSADAQEKLADCTPESVARAIILSGLSGLYPGGPNPDVWLIPRKNKHNNNALEVNWQMSFRGYIRLARRAAWDLEPVLVFAGDVFEYEEGTAPRIRHVPDLTAKQNWETLLGGYVRVRPLGAPASESKIAWLSKDRIQQRRSKAQDGSIWTAWPLEQSLKTLCHFAGAREMFPCDDPARYAIVSDVQAEIGGGEPHPVTIPVSASPVGSGARTEALAARLEGSSLPQNGAGGDDPLGEPTDGGGHQGGGGEGDEGLEIVGEELLDQDQGGGGSDAGAAAPPVEASGSAGPQPGAPGKRPKLNAGEVEKIRALLVQPPQVEEVRLCRVIDPRDIGSAVLQNLEGFPGEDPGVFYTRVLTQIKALNARPPKD